LHPQVPQLCLSSSRCQRLLLLPLPLLLLPVGRALLQLLVEWSVCMMCVSLLLLPGGWCCCTKSSLRCPAGKTSLK
jgi:hypothetical protein